MKRSTIEHQIVGFHFQVSFRNLSGNTDSDMKFQSVSGLDVQIDKEALKEGGENRFEHNLPGRAKYGSLTLKRGILTPEESGITKWCQSAFYDLQIKPIKVVDVELLNEHHKVLMKWVLTHVWPVSWKVSEFNAEKGEVLLETLELNYNYFKMESVS